MNKFSLYIIWSSIISAVLMVGSLSAQVHFGFEAQDPVQWQSTKGELSLTAQRFKEGSSSLKWTLGQNDVLHIKTKDLGLKNGISFYVYNYGSVTDSLLVKYNTDVEVQQLGTVALDFKGWRYCFIPLSNTLKPRDAVKSLQFSVNSNSSIRELLLDDLNFGALPPKGFQYGAQVILDVAHYGREADLLRWYSNRKDIPLVPTGVNEKQAIKALQKAYTASFTEPTMKELLLAYSFVQSIEGKAIDLSTPIAEKFMLDLSTSLLHLVTSGKKADQEAAQSFMEYLLDQGIAAGVPFSIEHGHYDMVRNIPKGFLAVLPLLSAEHRNATIKLLQWIMEYGKIYNPATNYLANLNADVITNTIEILYEIALAQNDIDMVSQDLKAITRYLERHMEYVPGEKDLLKPDGTAFHHKTHYNGYMYSFVDWINMVYRLNNTPYQIKKEAYERFKQAVIAMYVMGTLADDDQRFTAHALSGRNPFGLGGSKVQVDKAHFKKLIDISKGFYSGTEDPELNEAYAYFFKLRGADKSRYEGFYQFNYSPIGVYRKDNWVATMRSPTTKFWGAEIYSKRNRFGRYQSHGTLEIMYEGSLKDNGYLDDKEGAGWDWNVIPGSTTVHYKNWEEMLPGGNVNQRFDQNSKSSNFAGGLAFDDIGIFACTFDQSDQWGKGASCFVPTNLAFKKSVFAFDGLLVALGSGISSSGDYADDRLTATNLFQYIVNGKNDRFYVNGNRVNPSKEESLVEGGSWLLTPTSTGFIIPKGNDSIITYFGNQSSPGHSGLDLSLSRLPVTAIKSYLNHGVKSQNKQYYYITIPNSNVSEMQRYNTILKDKDNAIFNIIRQDDQVHALTLKERNTEFYTVFGAVDGLSEGTLVSTDSEMLLIVKQDGKELRLAVCNPDLKPIDNKDYGWVSTASKCSFVLKGIWKPKEDTDMVVNIEAGNTRVNVILQDGKTRYLSLDR